MASIKKVLSEIGESQHKRVKTTPTNSGSNEVETRVEREMKLRISDMYTLYPEQEKNKVAMDVST